MKPKSLIYYTVSLKIVIFASLLVGGWHGFTAAPTIIKLIYSLIIWCALVLFPWTWIKFNDFPIGGKLLLNGMLFWGVFEIIRSLFGFSIEPTTFGNRYVTLFFNEYCALLFMPPLYAYTVDRFNILSILFRCSKIFIWGSLIFSILFISIVAIYRLATNIVVFWKYVGQRNRIYIKIVYIFTFVFAILGGRSYFIFIFYSLAAYLTCYFRDLKRLRKIICIFSILLPIISFFPLFSSSAQNKDSGFKVILDYVGKQVGGGDEFQADTRTFLYLEMALDLTRNNAWIIGKGANSTYYSEYFKNSIGGDNYNRLTSEVPILLFLLRGGIVYVGLYLSFFLLCIYRSIWQGKSRFINCIGIMLSGWFANLFIADLTGCSFFHIIIFSLCGMVLSPKWLNKTDKEIKFLVNSKSIINI